MKTFDTEKKVKAELRKQLKAIGVWQYWPVPGGMGRSGVADTLFLHRGKFFSIECKRPGRRGEKDRGCTRLQILDMQDVIDNGGQAFVCDCLEEIEAIVELARLAGGAER